MKFTITKASPESFNADIIAVGLFERADDGSENKHRPVLIKHVDGGIALDRALKGELSSQIAKEKFKGERGSSRVLFTAGRIPARFVILIGMGKRKDCSLSILREAGAVIAGAALDYACQSAALVLERGSVDDMPAPSRARAIAEGLILGSYRFNQYKTVEEKKPALSSVSFLYHGDAAPVKAAVNIGSIMAEAQNLARNLVNMPALDSTPRIIAGLAKNIAKKFGLKCKVLDVNSIRREKMGGLLSVARGSAEPPVFIELTYKPAGKTHAHIALIGKGVTFDSGGISLKPPRGMELMKDDKAGAAAVLYAMQAIAQLKPKIQVSAFIPATENMPDGKAIKPGDVVKMRNNMTVETVSTDCEGRMILADALSYAADKKPDLIIDVATLTGGAVYCCGELYTLVLGTDQKLVDRLRRAAEEEGEPMWQLPIVEEYKKGYTSGIADLNNTGKSKAQTIMGAIFLREFVKKTAWAHMDIAASSWTEDALPISPKGATGVMVRTLAEFVVGFKGKVSG